MTKPITPKQARKMVVGSPDHTAYLKNLVIRRLNRELKKGFKSIKIANHIEESLAREIANDYSKQGWTVTIKDSRKTLDNVGWSFFFTVEFNVGEIVEIQMNDRLSWPEIFEAKVLEVQSTGFVNEKRYNVEFKDEHDSARSVWLVSSYLQKRRA